MRRSATPDAPIGPVAASERIVAIDTLRGVAVLGILVMNVYAFAMSFVAYQNPLADGGTEWYNLATWYFTHLLFDQKFLSIFAMLFGAGLILMTTRAAARGTPYRGVWFRRNVWLLLIGALHGYLLWFGDILFHYALMGMLIYPFRNRSPRALIIIAAVLLSLGMVAAFLGGSYMQQMKADVGEIRTLEQAGKELTQEQAEMLTDWAKVEEFMKPPARQVSEDNAAYRGDYAEILAHRAPIVVMMQTQGTLGFILWRVGGLMLLGMALMKLGVLSGERPLEFYRRMMFIGYGIGLPIVALGACIQWLHQWEMFWLFRSGTLPNYVGSVFVAAGHVGLVMTIVKSGALAGLARRFSALGRMAFTNYLLHSIILTTVFYGYGLGLYGHVPRVAQMAFVVAVIGLQLWLSPIWLARFRFGPAEWLWRSLTYWRLQPMRLPAAAAPV
jgi:uncharacterized protein